MSKVSSFVIGGLLGAGIALLVAPRSGAETRAKVVETVNGLGSDVSGADLGEAARRTWDNAVAKGEEWYAKGSAYVSDAAAKVSDAASDAATKISDYADQASGKVQDAVATAVTSKRDEATQAAPAFSDVDDELRAKMETARQRIAEQIARNAEEAKARAASVLPAENKAEVEASVADAKEATEQAAEAVKEAVADVTAAVKDAAQNK